MTPQKKKLLIILAAVALVIGAVAAFFVVRNKRTTPEPEVEDTRRRISEPVNVIPIAERPYLNILPLADGRHLTIQVLEVNKQAHEVEYELEYQSGAMLQGAMGQLDLSTLPVSEKIMLGSCSAGGACTYHENVTGGNLLLTFVGEENYAVKTNWRYFNNINQSNQVSSWDAKFQLESKSLIPVRFTIVFNSPGVPKGLEELLEDNQELRLLADHYALTSSTPLTGEGEVMIRLNEDTQSARIVGYDGKSWVEFETALDGKEATAQVELMELYTVIE